LSRRAHRRRTAAAYRRWIFTVDVETSMRYEQTACEVAMRELEDARALTL
jgi:hypothetical protein